jgi:hypothetical protein
LFVFLKYDFTLMYKPRKIHVVADALLRLQNIIEPTSVPNQTTICKFVLHRAWMVEWCKRIFENRLDWEHVIDIIEVEIVRENRTFHPKKWWIVHNGPR